MSTADAIARPRFQQPPEVPGGLPFLGHALEFHRNPVRFLQRGRERFGEIFCFLLAGHRVAVLTGPRANEAFFRASSDQLSARDAYQFTVPIFGKDVAYAASEDRMAEQLDLITPALSERRLRTYVDYIREEVESYIAPWGDEGTVDLVALGNELTVFVASRCLIGREFRQNLSAEFAHLYHDLEGGLNLVGFFWPRLPLPAFKRRDRARARMVEVISRIIAERKASGVEGEDFLQTLMTARYADGAGLSDDNITGLLLTLIFAGQHTSAVLAAWVGVELLRHPDFLARVREEQDLVLGTTDRLSFDALRQMVLLERGVKETERLHPPLILLMRKIRRDFFYRHYRMPAGWLAMVSPAVSNRLAEVFREPDRYDPDRYAPGRAEDKKARFSQITFGGGRHACLGMIFAYLQVKTIWSVLLQRFELELLHPNPEPNYATFVVGPRPPCLMRYRRKRRPAGPSANGS
jgi:sterol 14alpha-demethylase